MLFMIHYLEVAIGTLPLHDRLSAWRMLRDLQATPDMKTLARLLKFLQRYGIKFEEESLDRLLKDIVK